MQYLITRISLDLTELAYGIFDATENESKVKVDASASVVGLSHSTRSDRSIGYSLLLARAHDTLLDLLAQVHHVRPRHRGLERLGNQPVCVAYIGTTKNNRALVSRPQQRAAVELYHIDSAPYRSLEDTQS